MQVRIWGVRGSYPVARPDMLGYGGNTSAVEVRIGNTIILLDAGTGLWPLGQELCRQPEETRQRLHLFITHTHWDHIVGLPFFAPLLEPKTNLSIYGLQRTQASLHKIIAGAMSDTLLPVGMNSIQATVAFSELHDGAAVDVDGVATVRTARVNHPYRALGYRVESAGGTLVYMPDTGPFHTVLFGDDYVGWNGSNCGPNEQRQLDAMRSQVRTLMEGADWLIYDTQLTDEEYTQRPHWGHSTPSQAIELAAEAGVRQLLMFHHDPHRTDDQVEALLAANQPVAARLGLKLDAARERMCLVREAVA